jgi:hypothetical protein
MWQNLQIIEVLVWMLIAETGWVSKRFDIRQADHESQVLFGINPFLSRGLE